MRWKPLPFQVELWLSFSYQPVFVTNPSDLPNLEGILVMIFTLYAMLKSNDGSFH